MKACLAMLSMVLGLAAAAAADGGVFPRYAETLWLNVDGSARLAIELDCPAGTASPIRLPLSAPSLTGMAVSGVEPATASIVSEGERRYAVIDFPGPLAAPATLRVTGTVSQRLAAMTSPPKEFGNRTMTYRFLNSTSADFVAVTGQVVLPDGFVVASIDDSEPPETESSVTPPSAVVSVDGRHAVRIAAGHVGLGGTASVTFQFKERKLSPLLPVALVALGAAYLVGFRSLTSRAPRPTD